MKASPTGIREAFEMSNAPCILVVGSEPRRLRATSKRLRAADYEVLEATDGRDGLRLARERKPDLTLLDDSLTGISAVDLCRLLRTEESLAGMGLILLVDAVQAPADQAEGLQAGADAYIAHRLPDHEFLARVEAVLRPRRINKALLESEEQFRAVSEHSLDLIHIVNAGGQLTYASPSHEPVLGYAPQELVNENMLELVHPQDLKQVQSILDEIQQEPGAAASATFRIRHKDGTWRWLESTGRNLLDNPSIRGIVGTSRDITARVQAEERLQESRSKFKAQYKGLPIPVYTWQRVDDDFVLIDYNYAAEEITQGNVVQLLGATASQLYQDTPDILAEMRQCHQQQRSFQREMLYEFRSTNDTRHLSVSYGFVPPDIVLVHTADVTERIQTELALHRLRGELEQRVQERTAELQQANTTLIAEIAKREQAQQESEKSHQRERVLNALLRISIDDIPLAQQLEQALDEILSIPWLPVLPQGAIFLVGQDPKVLELQIARSLGPAFEEACARVNFGRCLCGTAVDTAQIQFAAGIDERHEIDYAGMQPHGHYCIPILSGPKPIGVLVLYLDEGHQQNEEEQDFLRAVAHSLAGIIDRKWGEQALRDSERRYRLLAENATDMISRHSPEGIYRYASPVCHNLLGYEPEELIGHDAYEFFHPDDLVAIQESHSTILEEPTISTLAYRIRRRDGSYLWVETTSKTVHHPTTGQVEEIIAITRDITQRKQAEQALQANEQQLRELYAQLEDHSRTLEHKVAARTQEIEQRRQVAESLGGMLTVLNSDLPLDEILEHIVVEASRLLGSDASAIYRLEGSDGIFTPHTVRGLAAEEISDLAFPPDLGRALRSSRPVAIPDVTDVAIGSDLLSALECMADCCLALLAVPLIVKSEVYGGLLLYYSEPRAVSDEEIGLAVAFADQAALAIENARLHEQVRAGAVREERARLARELHDSVTQALFSMTLLAEAGQRLAQTGDFERVQSYLGRLGETSHQSLKEMRLLVYELRPLALKSVGLVGALQHRLDAVEARAGVEARLLVDGTILAPAGMEEDLYRIAEQALNNALKHASATSVTTRLQGNNRRLVLEVSDNGCGFDPEAAKEKGGQGLVSMQERAARVGGTLTLSSVPGQGTTVRIEVEMPDNADTHSDPE
jgi:PAS domain S-box-containing protein